MSWGAQGQTRTPDLGAGEQRAEELTGVAVAANMCVVGWVLVQLGSVA